MKKLFIAILLFTVSCAPIPSSVTTPQGQYAFKADQVVSALGIFQDAAIAANTNKLLNDNDTGIIVRFVRGEVVVLQSGNSNYKVQIQLAINQLNKDLSSSAQQKYGTYITLISNVVDAL